MWDNKITRDTAAVIASSAENKVQANLTVHITPHLFSNYKFDMTKDIVCTAQAAPEGTACQEPRLPQGIIMSLYTGSPLKSKVKNCQLEWHQLYYIKNQSQRESIQKL